MDELLTDLKSYDNHKASRHEAKAGGGGRKVEEVILGRSCAGRGGLQGFSLQREGKVFKRRDVARSMFPSEGREPSMSWTGGGRRMMRRKGAKSSLAAAVRPGGAGQPWEGTMWRGPSVFLRWKAVHGQVPAPGEPGDGAVLSLVAAGPTTAPRCVSRGGRAGFPLCGAGSRLNNEPSRLGLSLHCGRELFT